MGEIVLDVLDLRLTKELCLDIHNPLAPNIFSHSQVPASRFQLPSEDNKNFFSILERRTIWCQPGSIEEKMVILSEQVN